MSKENWLRGRDLNPRPLGYEPTSKWPVVDFYGEITKENADGATCQPRAPHLVPAGERGVILIVVAVTMIGLLVFLGLVMDQGILYTSRRQAQNAADAAALAGALARTWDDTEPLPSSTSGVVWQNVVGAAAANPIWGIAPPPASVELGFTCPAGPAFGTTQCVVVDVHRDGTHGSQTLPVTMLQLVGIREQRIRAHAVAWPAGSNISDCLRPWFVLNKPGAGYTTDDIGDQIILDSEVTPSGFGKIDVGNGEAAVVSAVHSCAPGGNFHVGETVATQTGAAGVPTVAAVNDVIGWDILAHYDPTTKTIQGSCAPRCDCDPFVCPNASKGMSPRVFIAPLCAPVGDAGCVSGGNGRTHQITITSFLSFFIESATSHGNGIRIVATLIGGAGDYSADFPGPTAPFLRTVQLIR